MKNEMLSKLRNRRSVNLFISAKKLFVKIQLNRKESFICWQRYVSIDRINWIGQNNHLSLKDVDSILKSYQKN